MGTVLTRSRKQSNDSQKQKEITPKVDTEAEQQKQKQQPTETTGHDGNTPVPPVESNPEPVVIDTPISSAQVDNAVVES